jgi:Flp pilus assembly protein TadB
MTGTADAAVLLAVALLVLPRSPRRRLVPRPRAGDGRLRLAGRAAPAALALGCLFAAGPFVAAGSLALGGTVWLRCRRRAARRKADREGRDMESALDVLVSELRVGTHPVRAFAVAADETDGLVGQSFRAVAARAGLGADVPAGLRSVASRSAGGAHWDRLAVCWELAAEHGLAISTLMRAAALDISERQRFSARVQAGMAGARATASILAALPVLGVVLGELIGASPLTFLLGSAGGWFLVVGAALVCAGLLWADRITDRVLS